MTMIINQRLNDNITPPAGKCTYLPPPPTPSIANGPVMEFLWASFRLPMDSL